MALQGRYALQKTLALTNSITFADYGRERSRRRASELGEHRESRTAPSCSACPYTHRRAAQVAVSGEIYPWVGVWGRGCPVSGRTAADSQYRVNAVAGAALGWDSLGIRWRPIPAHAGTSSVVYGSGPRTT